MGKNRKSSSVGGGKKRKGVIRVESCVSDVEEDSNGSDSPEKGKGSRNGTIRHVYTTNSDMDCIEEYLKPVYKDGEVILEVECGSNKAMMYLSKLCQGSKGPCVEFQGSWLTPNEFQYVSGRETAKDWKRSIRHQGKSMKLLLTKGVLSVHSTVCDCEGCRVTSPVNRCRLAEKRRSVYSANRKERLTIESFTSCGASSLDGISDILDKPSEENVVVPLKESKEIVSEKKISSKHCSPLRESRLSNIIEQLRSSKEREKSDDLDQAFKKDFYEDEKRTRDENGNEGEDDTDGELSDKMAAVEEKPVEEKPVEEKPVEEKDSLSSEKEPNLSDIEKDVTPEPIVVESEDEQQELVQIKKDTDIADTALPDPPLETTKEEPEVEVSQKNSNSVQAPEKMSFQENDDAVENTVSDRIHCSTIRAPVETVQNVKTTPVESEPDIETEPIEPVPAVKSAPVELSTKSKEETMKVTESMCIESDKKSAQQNVESYKAGTPFRGTKDTTKSPIASTHSSIRKERRQEKDSRSRCSSVKRSSPAAPTQGYSPAVSSCLTALPASVPEQLFTGDANGAKYSDFIRLLAASHLGGHLPLLPDRLLNDGLQGFPMVPSFAGLQHPFPSHPFFPHPVHMKDTSHFQVPPMTMPPAFIPPYMYRPFGLFPHAFLDPGSQCLTPPAELQKPPPKESPTNSNRKRVSSPSEIDSALDLSTKRSKLVEESVSRKDHYHTKKSTTKKTGTIHPENGVLNLGKSSRVSDRHGISISDTSSALESLRKHHVHSECSCRSLKKDDIRLWSVSEVGKFLQTLDGCYVYADTFREHRVDGKSLPLLTVEHLMHNIGMKLGPAVLLTRTVAKRLKFAKQAHKKCPKCDSAVSELISLQNYKLMSGKNV